MRRDIINLLMGLFFLAVGAGLSACGGGGEIGNGGVNSISGAINLSTGVGIFQVSLALFGDGSGNIFTDSNGFYQFSNLQDGTYSIVPSKTGYTFLPPVLTVTIDGASLTGQNFLAYATASQNLTALSSTGFKQNSVDLHAHAGDATGVLSIRSSEAVR
jgi:hypothetical protein